jgi:cell division protein FtsQ
MANEFWKNQIVQINVLPDLGVELVPRVGEHIIFIGYLPQSKDDATRKVLITDYINKKLERLEKFYQYGLNTAGWNKYHYISLEFDNQIICKKTVKSMPAYTPPAPKTEEKKDSTATIKKDTIKQDNNKKTV